VERSLSRLFSLCLATFAVVHSAAEVQSQTTPLDALKERGTIKLCADADFLPHSHSGMNPPGFDVEVAQAVAKQLDLELSMHWVITLKGFRALRNLYDRECDFFMGLPRDESFLEEAFRLDVTAPYYNGGFARLVRSDAKSTNLADYKSAGVGVQMATVPDFRLFGRGIERKLYRNVDAVFAALVAKEIEIAVVPALEAAWLVHTNREAGLKILDTTDAEFLYPMGFGVRKKEQDVKAALESAIASLREDGTLERLREKYGVPMLVSDAEAVKPPNDAGSAVEPAADVQERGDTAPVTKENDVAAEFPSDAKSIDAGRRLYKQACYKCHGPNGVSGGTIPDLRHFNGDHFEMFAIIQGGRIEKGMPAWSEYLDTEETKKIVAYIMSLPKD
jgi:polar amino acid transport system substrate-binding protein